MTKKGIGYERDLTLILGAAPVTYGAWGTDVFLNYYLDDTFKRSETIMHSGSGGEIGIALPSYGAAFEWESNDKPLGVTVTMDVANYCLYIDGLTDSMTINVYFYTDPTQIGDPGDTTNNLGYHVVEVNYFYDSSKLAVSYVRVYTGKSTTIDLSFYIGKYGEQYELTYWPGVNGYRDGNKFVVTSVTSSERMIYLMVEWSSSSRYEDPDLYEWSSVLNFKTTRTYTQGLFSDVQGDTWFSSNVAKAYELGLMQGTGGKFEHGKQVTVAETLAMAARLHNIYFGSSGEFSQGSPWYQVYVDYCDTYDISEDPLFDLGDPDYTTAELLSPITRGEFCQLMYNTFRVSDFGNATFRENGTEFADSNDMSFYAQQLALYGIITGSLGSDGLYYFNADNTITRAEVAAIVSRMAAPYLRVFTHDKFTFI